MTDFIGDGPEKVDMVTSFIVPGVPIAQPRQRHRAVFSDGKIRTINYMPSKHPVSTYKAAIRLVAAEVYTGPVLDEPLLVRIEAVFPRPKNKMWKRKSMPREPWARRPDAENIVKAILDSLTKLIYRDDSLIDLASVRRWMAAGDEQPHTEIEIAKLYRPAIP